MSVNNSLVCWGIEKYGSEEQKEKYLHKLGAKTVINRKDYKINKKKPLSN